MSRLRTRRDDPVEAVSTEKRCPYAAVRGTYSAWSHCLHQAQVPKDIDVSKYSSIVIWCEITRNAYAAASIQR